MGVEAGAGPQAQLEPHPGATGPTTRATHSHRRKLDMTALQPLEIQAVDIFAKKKQRLSRESGMDRAATRLSASASRICTLLASGIALAACLCGPPSHAEPDAGSQCPAVVDGGWSPLPALFPVAVGQRVGWQIEVGDGGLIVTEGDVEVVGTAGQVSLLVPYPGRDSPIGPDAGFVYGADATAVLADGTLLIADTAGNCIRRFDPVRGLRTLAGLCAPGNLLGSGEFADGPGISARFAFPMGIAVDGAGNAIVADTHNNRVRMLDPSGNVTTIAGTGRAAREDGPLVIASFEDPEAVAVAPDGRIFVVDGSNIRVIDRQMSAPLGNVSTLAGIDGIGFADGSGPDGVAAFNRPSSLAVDAAGNVYVADSGNFRIRKIDPAGNVTTVIGDGTGCYQPGPLPPNGPANIADPTGVALDAAGNLYIAGGMPLSIIRF